jgi:hypothetical protein
MPYILLSICLLAIFVNFFVKSFALSILITFLAIGIILWPEVNQWIQYGGIALMVGGLFGIFNKMFGVLA